MSSNSPGLPDSNKDSISFRRERFAKKHLLDRQNHQAKKTAVITYTLFQGGWIDHFLFHYLSYTESDIFIVLTGSVSMLESRFLPNDRVQILSLPSIPFKDWTKAFFLEMFSSSLRIAYDYTIICDVDEIVMAYSPETGMLVPKLEDALYDIDKQDAIRCYGLNVLQCDDEPDLSSNLPFFKQRKATHPVTAMNKPCVLGDYHIVSGGQHFTDIPCPVQPFDSTSSSSKTYMFINFHLKNACKATQLEVNQRIKLIDNRNANRSRYEQQLDDKLRDGYTFYDRLKQNDMVSFSSPQFALFYSNWNSALSQDQRPSIHRVFRSPQMAARFLARIPAMQ